MKKKGSQDGISGMGCVNGDRIIYTGYSGNNGTVVTSDIPTQDSTIVFNFVDCGDGIHYYLTVKIDTQTWMAENLKTTKYNDGTAITQVAGSEPSTEAYTYYDNDISNLNIYGALYNWYAVNTGKLCPTGWHVPYLAEWNTLADFLGSVFVAGGKMKEKGYNHWFTPNTGATNERGFGALPGGKGVTNFFSKGENAYFWSSSEYESNNSWSYYTQLSYDSYLVGIGGATVKEYGFSVRCLKDN